jgi:hypothetical protein
MPKLETVEAYHCPCHDAVVTPDDCETCEYDGGWDGKQKCEYRENEE